jgi:ribonuclease Z
MSQQIWTYQLPYGLTIKGFSRGSQNTGFVIPELKLMFDAQMRSDSCSHIFITHGHTDHIFSLPMRICNVPKQPIVCIPNEIKEMTKKFIDSVYQLGYYNPECSYDCNLVGVKENDIIPLNSNYRIKVYELDHLVPCRGYGIQRIKTKLKQEYQNIPKEEIIKLKKQKIQITEEVIENVFAYITDTQPTVFTRYPELLTYAYIMTECTFLPIDDPENKNIVIAREAKHTHWNELYLIMENNKQIQFMLIHFSIRYTNEELEQFKMSNKLENVIFVI